MLKVLPYLIFPALFILYLLPSSQVGLTNSVEGLPAAQYELITPPGIFEPFVGVAYYFLRLYNMKLQVLSWILWIIFFNILAVLVVFRRGLIQTAKITFVSLFFFFVFVSYLIFFPLPKYRIESKNPDFCLVDLHSHTEYSHDGLVKPENSIKWHIGHGFDGWFITDHDLIDGAKHARKVAPQKKIFTGEEIQDKYGNALLVLGLNESVSEYVGKDTKEITGVVHEKGGAVLVGHWWDERGSGLSALGQAGVDGFEIYGHTAEPLTGEARLEIIKFCMENNLVMTGGSNWHGLGTMNDVWTSIEVPGWQKLDMYALEKKIVQIIRSREKEKISVVVFSKSEPLTNLRFIFEPFVGLYLYFTALTLKQLLTWVFWAIIFFRCMRVYSNLSYHTKLKIKSVIYLFFGIVMIVFAVVLFFRWKGLGVYNRALFEMARAHIVIGVLFLVLVFRKLSKLYN
jgi:hypothetical protein